jgi:hypothetical protein
MKTNVIIVDDFYSNPDQVRNFALTQPFDITGNFPGARTTQFLTEDTKQAIQDIIFAAGGIITDWLEQYGYTGAFQLCTANDRTWIHADPFNTWAGVCYLTPNAPISSGTALYKHISSGEFSKTNDDYESNDYTKWEMTDYIANRYNRLVLYRGDLFHASLNYFGDSLYNARLFQTFFFNTEY